MFGKKSKRIRELEKELRDAKTEAAIFRSSRAKEKSGDPFENYFSRVKQLLSVGLLITTEYPLGTAIYRTDDSGFDNAIVKHRLVGYTIRGGSCIEYLTSDTSGMHDELSFHDDDIGKTVFFSKNDAAIALYADKPPFDMRGDGI